MGPQVGQGRGGILREGGAVCVENNEHATGRVWQFYDGAGFQEDPSMRVGCYEPGDEYQGKDGSGNIYSRKY